MTKKTAAAPRQPAKVVQLRRGTTLEMVRLACPDMTQAARISESFGLAIIDSETGNFSEVRLRAGGTVWA